MLYTIRDLEYRIVAERSNAVCENCGREYWVKPSALARSRFCSRACLDAGRNGGAISRETLERLYYAENRSMQQIADALGCGLDKVRYWMRQYGFERRDQSEAGYFYHNPDGDPFTISVPNTIDELKLFGLGLGIYMGEGDKTNEGIISLSNSNPDIHRVFIKFLETICGVPRTDLSAILQLYSDLDAEATTKWWAEQLRLGRAQFKNAWVREGKEGTYKTKANNGTLQLRFYNTKLKAFILEWCRLEYERHA